MFCHGTRLRQRGTLDAYDQAVTDALEEVMVEYKAALNDPSTYDIPELTEPIA
jgi:hypothetical protein